MDTITYIEAGRLDRAKFAYTTGHVQRGTLATLLHGRRPPRSGDLLLARVAEIGQHKKLERPDGRLSTLFRGDEVVVCYGHRYAPDQFEAEIPENLSPCHLVAGGGVASWVLSRHAGMAAPTVIEPIGFVGDREGRVVNLAAFALPPVRHIGPRPLTVVVVGTSMNAGKTTVAAHLIRGLTRAGHQVGAAKVTGTGSGKDLWLMRDAGADPVLDFTAAGFSTTYRASLAQVEGIFDLLTDRLATAGADAIVIEVADGLYQTETAALVTSPPFAARVDGVLFAAGEAMAAATGLAWLRKHGLRVLGVSGVLTASPLAVREAEVTIDVPVLPLERLGADSVAKVLELHALAA